MMCRPLFHHGGQHGLCGRRVRRTSMPARRVLNDYVSGEKLNMMMRFKSVLASAVGCPDAWSKSMPELGTTCGSGCLGPFADVTSPNSHYQGTVGPMGPSMVQQQAQSIMVAHRVGDAMSRYVDPPELHSGHGVTKFGISQNTGNVTYWPRKIIGHGSLQGIKQSLRCCSKTAEDNNRRSRVYPPDTRECRPYGICG